MRLYAIILRHDRGILLGWSLGLFAFLFLIGVSYAVVRDNPDYDKLWEEFPESVREAFGGASSLTSVDGYLESQATGLFPILLGLVTILGATKRLCGAEESGALDHILARPISRMQYATRVALSQATVLLSLLAASAIGAVLGLLVAGVRDLDLLRAIGLMVDLVPFALFSLGLAMLLGAHYHRRSPALGVGVAIVVGAFALNIVAHLDDSLEWIQWFTPVSYWARSDLFHGEPDVAYYLLLSLLGAALLAAALWRFDEKDLVA